MQIRAIVGVPGAGKTRRVAEEVTAFVRGMDFSEYERSEGLPVVLSYTRAAAEEIASRITGLKSGPRDKRAGTVHSFAHRSLRDVLAGFETKGVIDKNDDLIKKFNSGTRSSFMLNMGGGRRKGSPYDAAKGSDGDSLLQEAGRLRQMMTPMSEFPARVAAFHAEWSKFKADNDAYDFTDLIVMATEESPYCPGKPAAIWLDESQDLSPLMLALVRKWAAHESCGMLTLVGDPCQALYTFAGADPTIFDSPKIQTTVKLDRSWRTPRKIHAVAAKWIKQLRSHSVIEYTPADRDGSVEYLQANYRSPLRVLERVEANIAAGKTTMIQASCGFMLNATLAGLRRRGVPYANPWVKNNGLFNPLPHGNPKRVTITDRIIALLDFEGGNWAVSDLKKWAAVLGTDRTGGPLKWGAKKRIEECDDEGWVTTEHIDEWFSDYAILEAGIAEDQRGVLKAWQDAVSPELRRRTEFPLEIVRKRGVEGLREPPAVFCGSIHSFKGAEADETIIFPDLSTAGQREWSSSTTRDSIIRLGYVAMTRARESLVVTSYFPKRGFGYMKLLKGV